MRGRGRHADTPAPARHRTAAGSPAGRDETARWMSQKLQAGIDLQPDHCLSRSLNQSGAHSPRTDN